MNQTHKQHTNHLYAEVFTHKLISKNFNKLRLSGMINVLRHESHCLIGKKIRQILHIPRLKKYIKMIHTRLKRIKILQIARFHSLHHP